MFTARVPGHGQIDWTAEQVDDHAEQLRRTHLPDSSSHRLRWWRLPPRLALLRHASTTTPAVGRCRQSVRCCPHDPNHLERSPVDVCWIH